MTRLVLLLAVLAAPGLAACSSTSGGGSGEREVGGFRTSGRSSDTLGTQRRLDVYGGATAPVLPTMGAVGYGK